MDELLFHKGGGRQHVIFRLQLSFTECQAGLVIRHDAQRDACGARFLGEADPIVVRRIDVLQVLVDLHVFLASRHTALAAAIVRNHVRGQVGDVDADSVRARVLGGLHDADGLIDRAVVSPGHFRNDESVLVCHDSISRGKSASDV
ncbi:hypothetical protein D3C73_1159420 [compost metagenome]